MRPSARLLVLSLLGFAGCGGPTTMPSDMGPAGDRPVSMDRADPADMPADGGGGDGGDPGLRISNIQNPADLAHPMPGSGVRLKGKIAITPKALLTDRPGAEVCEYGVWIAEPMGGSYGGILVVVRDPPRKDTSAPCPPPSQGGMAIPADTRPGDVFDVEGTYQEFILPTAETGCTTADGTPCRATYAQIALAGGLGSLTRTATGAMPPEPSFLPVSEQGHREIDELKVIGLTTDVSERYRGMLIGVPDLRVVCGDFGNGFVAVDQPDSFTPTCQRPAPGDGGTDGGGLDDFRPEGFWLKRMQGFDFTAPLAPPQEFGFIIGVLWYDQHTGRWVLVPRSNDDLVPR